MASKVLNVCVTQKNLVYDLARNESPSDISVTFIETPALNLKANWRTIVKPWRKKLKMSRRAYFLLFKTYFYHTAIKEERSIERCIVLAWLRRFQKRSQIFHEN